MEQRNFIEEVESKQKNGQLQPPLPEEQAIHVSSDTAAIAPRKGVDNPPLSYSQQTQWFLYQLDPNNSSHNICATIYFTGSLEVTALKQSLNEIIRRHEALRTTFSTASGGQPVQVIRPNAILSLSVLNLQALPTPEQPTELQRFATEAAQQPFDLTAGPLLRAT